MMTVSIITYSTPARSKAALTKMQLFGHLLAGPLIMQVSGCFSSDALNAVMSCCNVLNATASPTACRCVGKGKGAG